MAATFKTPQYFSNNGHYYQAVVSSESWNSAVTTANNKTYLGLTGYLATITSKAENDFVAGVVGGNTWEYSYIGGSDSNTEGNFSWMTGPEAGQKISFSPWGQGGSEGKQGTGENVIALVPVFNFQWADVNEGGWYGYVIEYGGIMSDATLNESNGHYYSVVSSTKCNTV